MADEQISNNIETLVAEEHDLFHRSESEHGLTPDEHARLDAVRVELDQCWDLLRRRRALRSSGQDPDAATVRDSETVERYRQ
jgi:hypothetical protein